MRGVMSRDVNTRVLGYPGPVWPTRVPTRVPLNQQSAHLPRSAIAFIKCGHIQTELLAAAESAERRVC